MHKQLFNIILSVFFISSLLLFQGCDIKTVPAVNESEDIVIDKIEEISFGILDIWQPQSEASVLIYNHIKDNFGIDIKPITLSNESWRDEINWMASANQLPDVFVHDIAENKIQFKQLINTGAIAPLPKDIWGQMKRLSEVLSWYEDIYSIDEKMYFIPRTYQTFDQTHGTTDVIFYRDDWAKDLGYTSFKDSAKFSDIIELLKNYRASDTDGNTIWDTWGITGSGGIDFLWSMFLAPFGVREWVYEDGQWIPGLLSQKAKNAIAWAAQLYRDGLIDPDFTTQTSERALQKFVAGKSGMLLASAYYQDIKDFEKKWKENNPDLSIKSAVKILPSYTTPSGTIFNEVETFDGGSLISSNVSDSKMQKILKLFDYMYTHEGRNLLTYGTETLTSQNIAQLQSFREANTEFSNILYLSSWNLDENQVTGVPKSAFAAYAKDVVENNIWPWSHERELFTNGMLTPEMCVFDIDYIAQEKLLHIIKTTRDFDDDWDRYIESMYMELNIQETIDEVNTYAQTYSQVKSIVYSNEN